jgi:hypothetical protein
MTRIAEAPEGLSFYVAATSSRLVGCGRVFLAEAHPCRLAWRIAV